MVVALLFLPYSSIALQPDDPVPFFVGKEILSLKNRLVTHERNEAEARASLQGAIDVLAMARKSGNREAETVAREAIAVAEGSISDLLKMKARDGSRLEVLEAAVRNVACSKDAGVSTFEKGEVTVRSGAGIKDRGGPRSGDTVETGKNGFIELLLPDHSQVAVAANTAVEILLLDAEKMESAYRFIRGKLHIVRACLKEAVDLRGVCWVTQYRVGGGVAAVRGTEFTLEKDEDGSTAISVMEGTIDVTESDSGRVVSAKAMERVLIEEAGSVKGPIPLKPDAIRRWWEAVQ